MGEVIQLRGGAQTQDRRLDRVPLFDEKSREYPISARIRRTWPQRSYTWGCGLNLDQGAEGACVGFGWAHELAARPAAATGVTNTFAREGLYWPIQRLDPWEGGSYPGANPFYEGTAVLTGAQYVKSLGAMDEYRWSFSLQELISAIGYAGPAVLGLNWYEGMFEPDAKGYIHPTGELLGGHCILCRGVSLPNRRFLLHNSWGAGWGMKGTCYLSFDEMDELLHQQGEACIPVRRRTMSFAVAA